MTKVVRTIEFFLDPLLVVVDEMRKICTDVTQQIISIHNRVVQLERHVQHNKFPPKNVPQGPPPIQRLPSSLEVANMVQLKHTYYCRGCHMLHDENTCAIYLERIVATYQPE